MKLSTAIKKRAVELDKGVDIKCYLCDEVAKRRSEFAKDKCLYCPVRDEISMSMGYADCVDWGMSIYGGEWRALEDALEIALACEMMGD